MVQPTPNHTPDTAITRAGGELIARGERRPSIYLSVEDTNPHVEDRRYKFSEVLDLYLTYVTLPKSPPQLNVKIKLCKNTTQRQHALEEQASKSAMWILDCLPAELIKEGTAITRRMKIITREALANDENVSEMALHLRQVFAAMLPREELDEFLSVHELSGVESKRKALNLFENRLDQLAEEIVFSVEGNIALSDNYPALEQSIDNFSDNINTSFARDFSPSLKAHLSLVYDWYKAITGSDSTTGGHSGHIIANMLCRWPSDDPILQLKNSKYY